MAGPVAMGFASHSRAQGLCGDPPPKHAPPTLVSSTGGRGGADLGAERLGAQNSCCVDKRDPGQSPQQVLEEEAGRTSGAAVSCPGPAVLCTKGIFPDQNIKVPLAVCSLWFIIRKSQTIPWRQLGQMSTPCWPELCPDGGCSRFVLPFPVVFNLTSALLLHPTAFPKST